MADCFDGWKNFGVPIRPCPSSLSFYRRGEQRGGGKEEGRGKERREGEMRKQTQIEEGGRREGLLRHRKGRQTRIYTLISGPEIGWDFQGIRGQFCILVSQEIGEIYRV